MAERRRTLIRIASNYGRLILTLVLGLIFVRVLLGQVGMAAYGLIAVLGTTVGIAAMLQDVVQKSMIRELGAAHHTGDRELFVATYNAALLVTGIVGLLSLLLFGALWAALPWLLVIPDELMAAARWFVVAKAGHTLVTILFAAPFNMLMVTERMTTYSGFMVAERASYLIAALMLPVLGLTEPAIAVIGFGFISAALAVVVLLTAVIVVMVLYREMWPAPHGVTGAALREVLQVGGWNTLAITAVNMHLRLDQFIMNRAFSTTGNAIFGLAMQLGSYVRMVAAGTTVGLEAVSTRISASSGGESGTRRLVAQSTRINSLVTMPTAAVMLLMAEPIIAVWVGDHLDEATSTLPLTVSVTRIMAIGLAARAISDGWLAILYGAGQVRRYALLILAGCLVNPVLALLLLATLPEAWRYIGPAAAFTLVFLVVHMGLFARLAGRLLEVALIDLYRPMFRPTLATLLASPVLFAWLWWQPEWNFAWLLIALAAFGTVYAAVCWFVALHPSERDGLTRMILRRVGRPQPERPIQADATGSSSSAGRS